MGIQPRVEAFHDVVANDSDILVDLPIIAFGCVPCFPAVWLPGGLSIKRIHLPAAT